MTTLITIFFVWLAISVLFFSIVAISIWIHSNKKGTKIWNFVNKHIIADEDDYIK